MDTTTDLSNLIYRIDTKEALDQMINSRYFGERVFVDPPTLHTELKNLVRLANDLFVYGEENRSTKSFFDISDVSDYTFKGPFCHVMNYFSRKVEFIRNGADPGEYTDEDLEHFCDDSVSNPMVHFGNFTIGRRL
ncbi:hypothetical protein [Sphingobacterium paludis]|uniref:Uncharacterized protein n=1 Tax=Sphingobacterium paludis TaxID=1476465 RepID=A0A4R7DDR2_9SPHI|nr:hypothetical protein [Sphingobacterium paludis]TDS17296.1 hypothetical protein B0I21_101160 [Sphingobacterium paludis]